MALHPKTNPQRAKAPPPEEGQHQEHRDAPPAHVVAVAAAFLSLVPIGLGLAAGTIEALDARHGIVMHYPQAPLFTHPSLPPLLADPVRHRREVEAEARSHLDPTRIEAAMEQVERQGGGGAQ